jgi:hypothetical protein
MHEVRLLPHLLIAIESSTLYAAFVERNLWGLPRPNGAGASDEWCLRLYTAERRIQCVFTRNAYSKSRRDAMLASLFGEGSCP